MNDTTTSAPEAQAPTGMVTKAYGMAVGVMTRILVHLCAFILALVVGIGGTPATSGLDVTAMLFFCTYVGIVCLLPRGMSTRPIWVVPTASGLLLCLLWAVMGVPFLYTFIFGGALTWTIRLLITKNRLGWEWAALPWLLLSLLGFLTARHELPVGPLPFWTFPVLALLGWGAYAFYTRRNFEPLMRSAISDDVATLAKINASTTLPDPLPEKSALVVEQFTRFLELSPRLEKSLSPLVQDLDEVAAALTKVARRPNPQLWDGHADEAFSKILRLNGIMEQRLQLLAPTSNPLAGEQEAALRAFSDSADGLIRKKHLLPQEIQGYVNAMYTSTQSILRCMRQDPQDMSPGEKFLNRYLPAAHKVVDEYARLAAQGMTADKVTETLARSRELLARLQTAFQEEHNNLLRNDTMDLMAELNVLDKLLKMEGK